MPTGALAHGALQCGLISATLLLVAGYAKPGDKDALLDLYESAGGHSWELQAGAPDDPMMQPGGNHNWNPQTDPCPKTSHYNLSWMGVACDDPCYYPTDGEGCSHGRVTGLNLAHNNLQGTIPPSLFENLINLTSLDLSFNNLSGTIPTTIGKLRNIQYVYSKPSSWLIYITCKISTHSALLATLLCFAGP